MMVIPAIDVKDGRCVRLRQGDMAAETVYSDDVARMARRWLSCASGITCRALAAMAGGMLSK